MIKKRHLGMFRFITLCLVLIGLTVAIPVDNGVEGEPEIECGPSSITVNFNTRNPFEGHVYVKGLFDQEGCRSDEGGRQVAGIELPFDTCNVARTRSLNPRGVFVTTTIVISFHPLFMTKVDRVYRVQCFYMEADKTVTTQLEVSEITTAFQTQIVPMPICRYEVGLPFLYHFHKLSWELHILRKITNQIIFANPFSLLIKFNTVLIFVRMHALMVDGFL